MSIYIRSIQKDDLTLLTTLWNDNVVFDPITYELLYEKTYGDFDFNPTTTLVAELDGRIVGFMMGLYRTTESGEKVGWIKLFFTVERCRRQGVASMLLKEIEKQLKSFGVSQIQILDCNPNYLQPGLDPFYTKAVAFVERRGFRKFDDTSNLVADLTTQNFDTSDEETRLAAESIEIRRARLEDKGDCAAFIAKEWPPWVIEVATAFNNNPISLHLAFLKGKLKAFSAYDANNFNTGWFGPMGTDPVFRGKGVGGILLKRCLQDIKNQGHRKSIIPWVGPIPFYMHYCNARVARVFWRYKKEM